MGAPGIRAPTAAGRGPTNIACVPPHTTHTSSTALPTRTPRTRPVSPRPSHESHAHAEAIVLVLEVDSQAPQPAEQQRAHFDAVRDREQDGYGEAAGGEEGRDELRPVQARRLLREHIAGAGAHAQHDVRQRREEHGRQDDQRQPGATRGGTLGHVRAHAAMLALTGACGRVSSAAVAGLSAADDSHAGGGGGGVRAAHQLSPNAKHERIWRNRAMEKVADMSRSFQMVSMVRCPPPARCGCALRLRNFTGPVTALGLPVGDCSSINLTRAPGPAVASPRNLTQNRARPRQRLAGSSPDERHGRSHAYYSDPPEAPRVSADPHVPCRHTGRGARRSPTKPAGSHPHG
eukprot:scaffold73416_cov57-Phaeocystis_antarctica.AAC.6